MKIFPNFLAVSGLLVSGLAWSADLTISDNTVGRMIEEGNTASATIEASNLLATEQVTVEYAFVSAGGDTAVAGTDYTAFVGQHVFDGALGATQTVTVNTNTFDNDDADGDRTFRVRLNSAVSDTGPAPALTAPTIKPFTIQDDGGPVVEFVNPNTDVAVTEGDLALATIGISNLDAGEQVTVNYEAHTNAADTPPAAAGVDYQVTTGQIIFNGANGATQTSDIQVQTLDNAADDGDRVFRTRITSATSSGTNNVDVLNVKRFTIVDDDAPSVIRIAAGNVFAMEDATSYSFEVSRSSEDGQGNPVSGASSITLSTQNVSAIDGEDYAAQSTVVTWADGDYAPKMLIFTDGPDDVLIDNEDLDVPNPRSFEFVMSNPVNATAHPTDNTAEIFIEDDELDKPGRVQFSATSAIVPENAGTVTLNVHRAGGSKGRITVDFRQQDVSAIAPRDYLRRDVQIVFEDGQLTPNAQPDVTIVDTADQDGTRAFQALLTNPGNGASLGADSEATVYIQDDEGGNNGGTIRFADAAPGSLRVTEGGAELDIQLLRLDGNDGRVEVDLVLTSETGTVDTDMLLLTGNPVVLTDGVETATVSVVAVDDAAIEDVETVLLRIEDVRGATLGSPAQVRVYIDDNEVAAAGDVRFVQDSLTVEGEGVITVPVVRENGRDGDLTRVVRTGTGGDTATAGEDYVFASTDIDYADQEAGVRNITIDLLDINDRSADELLTLVLTETDGTVVDTLPITLRPAPATGGSLSFTSATLTAPADAETLGVFVARANAFEGSVGVNIRHDAGASSAQSGVDFTAAPTTLTWDDGDSTFKSYTLNILDNPARVANRVVRLILETPTGDSELGQAVIDVTLPPFDAPPAPTSLRLGASQISFTEGDVGASVTVTREGPTNVESVFSVVTEEGTAVQGVDYQAMSQRYSFANGDVNPIQIPLNIFDNDRIDGQREFTVRLIVESGAVEGDTTEQVVTILDDEGNNPGVLSLAQRFRSVSEAVGALSIQVVRSGGTAGEARAILAATNGSATRGEDFSFSPVEVIFPNGSNTATVTPIVSIVDDQRPEGLENFTLVLSDAVGAALGSSTTLEVSIQDNDVADAGEVNFRSANGTVVLDAANAGSYQTTIRRTTAGGPASGSASASYQTVSGTAIAGVDFNFASSSVAWSDGESVDRPITIGILPNENRTAPRQFTIELRDVTGASLGVQDVHTVTIPANSANPTDPIPGAVRLEQSAYRVAENAGGVFINLLRINGTDGEVTVDLVPQSGGSGDPAVAEVDYSSRIETITIPDGQQFAGGFIQINDNGDAQSDRTFQVALANPTGGLTLSSPSSAVVTIEDDDTTGGRPGTLSLEDSVYFINEGQALTVRVDRVGGAAGEQRVKVRGVFSDPDVRAQVSDPSQTLIIPDGEDCSAPASCSVTFNTFANGVVDDGTSFTLVLELQDGTAALAEPTQATVRLRNVDTTAPSLFSMAAPTLRVNADDGSVPIQIFRETGSTGAVTVRVHAVEDFALSELPAEGGTDFQPGVQNVIFADGDVATKTVDIPLIDAGRSDDRAFLVYIEIADGNGALGSLLDTEVVVMGTVSSEAENNPGRIGFVETSLTLIEPAGCEAPGAIPATCADDRATAFLHLQRLGGLSGEQIVRVRPNFTTDPELEFEVEGGTQSLRFADGANVPDGNAAAIFRLPPNSEVDGTREFTVTLEILSGAATLLSPTTIPVKVLDNDVASSVVTINPSMVRISPTRSVATFNVVREGTGEVTVRAETHDGTAQAGLDYAPLAQNITFVEGDSSISTVQVTLITDRDTSTEKDFEVRLVPVSGNVTVGPDSTVVLTASDVTPEVNTGEFSFSTPFLSVNEDQGTFTIDVVRDRGFDNDVTVRILPSFPTDASRDVLTDASVQTLTFAGPPGNRDQVQTATYQLRDNALIDGTRALELVLSVNAADAGLSQPSTVTVTVRDDDAPEASEVSLSNAELTVRSDATTFNMGVLRIGGNAGSFRVRAEAVDPSALSAGQSPAILGIDVPAQTRDVTFAADGVSSQTVAIALTPNERRGDRVFDLVLEPANAASGAQLTANSILRTRVTIRDILVDNAPGLIVVDQALIAVVEGGEARFTLNRVQGVDGDVTVTARTAEGSALAGVDFLPRGPVLSWDDGDASSRIISVPTINNSDVDGTRTFSVALELIQGEAVLAVSNLSVTIVDNDAPDAPNNQATLLSPMSQIAENATTFTFGAIRSGNGLGSLSIPYSFVNPQLADVQGTVLESRYQDADAIAINGRDFIGAAGQFSWNDGEVGLKTVTMTVLRRDGDQPARGVVIRLSDTGVADVSVDRQLVIIEDVPDYQPTPGLVQFTQDRYSFKPAQSNRFCVERSGGTEGAIRVEVIAVAGTATPGTDYEDYVQQFDWNDGQDGAQCGQVVVLDDQFVNDKTFTLRLSNETADINVLGPRSTAQVVIRFGSSTGSGSLGLGMLLIGLLFAGRRACRRRRF